MSTSVQPHPLCQVYLKGRLSIMGPIAFCAECEQGWLYHEYVAAVRAADEEAESQRVHSREA